MPILPESALASPVPLAEDTVESAKRPFEEFYAQHFSFVWRNVRRLVDADSVVDDLVQEVFVVVVRRFAEFEGRSSHKTWLCGILVNVVRNHRKVSRRRGIRASADFDTFVDPNAGPHASFEKTQALRVLHELLAALDDAKREVFVLSELEQMTAPEISEITGANLTTVYARLRDARREVQEAAKRYRAAEGRRRA
jgi:RNA polymerase sigma-70 factor (ECF subfamily)